MYIPAHSRIPRTSRVRQYRNIHCIIHILLGWGNRTSDLTADIHCGYQQFAEQGYIIHDTRYPVCDKCLDWCPACIINLERPGMEVGLWNMGSRPSRHLYAPGFFFTRRKTITPETDASQPSRKSDRGSNRTKALA